MFKPIYTLFLVLVLLPAKLLYAVYDIEVITTHQKAELLLKKLEPLFKQQALLSASEHQLIVKGSSAVIEEVKFVLQKIDKANSNLLIQLKIIENSEQPSFNNKLSKHQNRIASTNYQLNQKVNKTNNTIHQQFFSTQKKEQTLFSFQAKVLEAHWLTINTGETKTNYTPTAINSVTTPATTLSPTTATMNAPANKFSAQNIQNIDKSTKKSEQSILIKTNIIDKDNIQVEIKVNTDFAIHNNKNKHNINQHHTFVQSKLDQWTEIMQIKIKDPKQLNHYLVHTYMINVQRID